MQQSRKCVGPAECAAWVYGHQDDGDKKLQPEPGQSDDPATPDVRCPGHGPDKARHRELSMTQPAKGEVEPELLPGKKESGQVMAALVDDSCCYNDYQG